MPGGTHCNGCKSKDVYKDRTRADNSIDCERTIVVPSLILVMMTRK